MDQTKLNNATGFFDSAIAPASSASSELESVFKKGFSQSTYDELFIEWLYLYEPDFRFFKDAICCYFRDLETRKRRMTRCALTEDFNPARAIKQCIKNITDNNRCFDC